MKKLKSKPPFTLKSITLDGARGPIAALSGGPLRAVQSPVFFVHGEGGLAPDDPFLLMLAQNHRVIAPILPGFAGGERGAPIEDVRDMLDFTLFGLEALEASGLRDPIVMGHSMGGMVAAEMAAVAPQSVTRLTLISALGLWLDEHPIADLFAAMPFELPALLFHDQAESAERMARAGVIGGGFDPGANDPNAFVEHMVRNARNLGAAGKLMFPIPDRGLKQRLYRIRARTSVIWGDNDRVTPSIYGEAFASSIAAARLIVVPEAGHMAHWEQPEAVLRAAAFA
ncbi:MAG: alpha/beta hydrolase [Caulobacterales bacterium]